MVIQDLVQVTLEVTWEPTPASTAVEAGTNSLKSYYCITKDCANGYRDLLQATLEVTWEPPPAATEVEAGANSSQSDFTSVAPSIQSADWDYNNCNGKIMLPEQPRKKKINIKTGAEQLRKLKNSGVNSRSVKSVKSKYVQNIVL